MLSIFSGDASMFDEVAVDLGSMFFLCKLNVVYILTESVPVPSPEISMWDEVCVYANEILTALNSMRYSHTSVLVSVI